MVPYYTIQQSIWIDEVVYDRYLLSMLYEVKTIWRTWPLKELSLKIYNVSLENTTEIFSTGEGNSCTTYLITQRHALNFFAKSSPVVGLKFGILDPLLSPVLMQPRDLILAVLEEEQLISDALPNKNATGMLVDNALLVL